MNEAKTVAAGIASTLIPDQSILIRFDELYYADLIGVEELFGDVERAMVEFRKKLKKLPGADPAKTLYDLSLDLSGAVEREVAASLDNILEQHRTISDLLKPKLSE